MMIAALWVARLVDLELLDHADLRPGDLHVLAGDQEGGVVEDRPDLVVTAPIVAGARAEDQRHGERDHEQG